MCCSKKRTPCCSACGRRSDCHRRSCTAKNPPTPVPSNQPDHPTEPIQHATNNGYDNPPHYEELAWPAQQDRALGYKQVGQEGQGGGLLGFIMGKYKSGSSGDAETVKALEYAYQAGRMAEKGEKA